MFNARVRPTCLRFLRDFMWTMLIFFNWTFSLGLPVSLYRQLEVSSVGCEPATLELTSRGILANSRPLIPLSVNAYDYLTSLYTVNSLKILTRKSGSYHSAITTA